MTSPNPFAPPSAGTTPPAAPPAAAEPLTARPLTAQPYGAQPYGAPSYPGQPFPPATAYGSGPLPGVPYQKPAHLRTGLAQAALFTGLGALVIALPTTLGAGGVVAGLVGLVLGVIALRRVRAGTGGGRAYAWWGIALSSVASVAGAALFTVAVTDIAEDAADARSDEDTADAIDPSGYDDAWDRGYDAGYEDGYAGVRYPAPAPGTEGSDVDPADVAQRAFGEPGPVGVYAVTVVDVSLDADDVVQPAFPGNAPPDGRYVMATISVTNTGAEAARPAMDLYHYYPGGDDLLYGDWSCAAWTPRPLMDVGPLAPGETVEYDVCFDVPLDAVDRPTLMVDDATSTVYRLTQWSPPDAA